MGKMLTLLVIMLFALASLAGSLLLNSMINDGVGRIAAGQIRLETGQPALEAGKAGLAAGQLKLSGGKAQYEHAQRNLFKVWADKLLKGGRGFETAEARIAAGDRQIAAGVILVDDGARRLEAGALELLEGQEQLRRARNALRVCALVAVFFVTLALVLGIYWRRSLTRVFRPAAT